MSQPVDICLRTCRLKVSKFGNFLTQGFILEYATTVEICFYGLMSILNDQVILANKIDELELRSTKC